MHEAMQFSVFREGVEILCLDLGIEDERAERLQKDSSHIF